MIREGHSYQVVADTFGVSKQRISQINSEYQEQISDDSYRDMDRTRLEKLDEDLFKRFIGPDEPLVSARGLVYEIDPATGQNFSKPVPDIRLKIELALAWTKIQERKAKLYGLDRNRQRERDQSGEMQEFLSYMTQLTDENDKLKKQVEILSRNVIEAEVVDSGEAIQE
jgi:hypothetical protein